MENEVKAGLKERRRHSIWKPAAAALWRRKFAILVLAGACVLALAGIRFVRASARNRMDVHATLLTLGRQAVRGSVRNDLRTSFSGDAETSIEQLADGRYQVNGWVDVITAQGGVERHRFSCTIYHDSGGAWAAEDVALLPE